ncbi:MAG TPA: peptide chain release factor 2 [Actinobacteria bacterium]|nr:peptide chain release factor 2 [Actinomycetota bacterium]
MIFDVDTKRDEITRLEKEASKPGFWDDQEAAQALMSKMSDIKDDIVAWEKADDDAEELEIMNELAVSEGDEALASDVERGFRRLKRYADDLELRSWFTDPLDSHSAIVTVHPGAGGTESQDWAEMLMRMVIQWSKDKHYQASVYEIAAGDEAGIKTATFTIQGKYAYGFLQAVRGVHRLVRISPFDYGGRRHTSFASVDVIPEVERDVQITIDPADLRIETYRSTGAGGQHVNVTDSAVRITHMPTGVMAQCQNERSQTKNKETAMIILRARLYERIQEEQAREAAERHKQKKEIAWGSQIMSYVLHPYQLVKDHRTGVEKGNVQAVLDGDLDDFIIEYHRQRISEAADG